jgi:hypothetical protein
MTHAGRVAAERVAAAALASAPLPRRSIGAPPGVDATLPRGSDSRHSDPLGDGSRRVPRQGRSSSGSTTMDPGDAA